jgi:Uma2 family endonuclease
MTYDRGVLEIMTLTHRHESYGAFLGRLAVTLTEELLLPIKEGGSTTFKRRAKQRGLEPDRCYWILNEPLVRGKLTIDLGIDPPPDLAIEVDLTRSSLNRMAIYAALRVPEVWRFDGRVLTFHVLDANGAYVVVSHSPIFPQVKPDDLLPFLSMRQQMDENEVIRQFRIWVRQHTTASGSNAPAP